MRIVLDTNVLLSGIFTQGLCEALLDVCLGDTQHSVVLSRHILSEFDRHARDKFGAPAAEVHRALEYLRSQVEMIHPVDVPAGIVRDADDLPVLGTALAAKADCLITGDSELLRLKEFQGVKILSPRAAYNHLV